MNQKLILIILIAVVVICAIYCVHNGSLCGKSEKFSFSDLTHDFGWLEHAVNPLIKNIGSMNQPPQQPQYPMNPQYPMTPQQMMQPQDSLYEQPIFRSNQLYTVPYDRKSYPVVYPGPNKHY